MKNKNIVFSQDFQKRTTIRILKNRIEACPKIAYPTLCLLKEIDNVTGEGE